MRISSHRPLFPLAGMALSAPTGIGGMGTPPGTAPMDPLAALTDCRRAAEALQTCAARFNDTIKMAEQALAKLTSSPPSQDQEAALSPSVARPTLHTATGDHASQALIETLAQAQAPLEYLAQFFTEFLGGAETPHTQAMQHVQNAISSALAMLGVDSAVTAQAPAVLPAAHAETASAPLLRVKAPPPPIRRIQQPRKMRPIQPEIDMFDFDDNKGLTDKGNSRRLNTVMRRVCNKSIDWNKRGFQNITHGDIRKVLNHLGQALKGETALKSARNQIARTKVLLADDAVLLKVVRTEPGHTYDDPSAALCRALLDVFMHSQLSGGKLKLLLSKDRTE